MDAGKDAGLVTTTRVTDASPGKNTIFRHYMLSGVEGYHICGKVLSIG